MIAIFSIGVFLTVFTMCITVSMLKDGYIEYVKNSFKDTPFLTVMFFIAQIVGALLLYFGFITPSSDISMPVHFC